VRYNSRPFHRYSEPAVLNCSFSSHSISDGHDPTSTEVEVVDLGQNSRIGRELEGIKL
jgi:hypothetical protein